MCRRRSDRRSRPLPVTDRPDHGHDKENCPARLAKQCLFSYQQGCAVAGELPPWECWGSLELAMVIIIMYASAGGRVACKHRVCDCISSVACDGGVIGCGFLADACMLLRSQDHPMIAYHHSSHT